MIRPPAPRCSRRGLIGFPVGSGGRGTCGRLILSALCAAIFSGCSPPSSAPPPDAKPLTGRQIFLAKCVVCHLADGKGVPNLYPSLTSSPRLSGPPEKLVRIMLLGLKGPQIRNGTTFNGMMPSWRFDLTDSQIADVLNDVIARWSPGTRALPLDLVTAMRRQTASEKLFPTPEVVDGN